MLEDIKEVIMRQRVVSAVALTLACAAAFVMLGAQSTRRRRRLAHGALQRQGPESGWRGPSGGGGVSPYVEARVHARGTRGQAERVERRPRSALAGRHRRKAKSFLTAGCISPPRRRMATSSFASIGC